MKKNTSKKVLNYAAMTAAILGTANAAGQIVYTDIDDLTLAAADEFAGIDFNDDGIVDIVTGLLNFTGGPGAIANGASDPADPNNTFNGNGIVGVPASGFYYPSNLSEGAMIDNASPIVTSQRGDMYVYACYANSQWCGEVTDKYLGASFDVDGATHYGWVRLDVFSNGGGGVGTMVIKDYAYDATPDTGIEAGDQGELSVGDNNFAGFTSFVDNNNVLNMRASLPLESVDIVNIAGQTVITQRLSNTNESLDLSSLSTGIYIANVSINGTQKAIKVVKR